MKRAIVAASLILVAVVATRAQSSSPAPVMPKYNAHRALILPADYRQWILAGSSLGLSYAEGAPAHPTFHETLIEPTAYQHFVRTGQFRDGTMLALIVHDPQEAAAPSKHGQYAAAVQAVEMAVKDSGRLPEGWGYYGFGQSPQPGAATAMPNPKASCYSCHVANAARDNVFLQFYSLLSAAAPRTN
jgi:hypothetical protein